MESEKVESNSDSKEKPTEENTVGDVDNGEDNKTPAESADEVKNEKCEDNEEAKAPNNSQKLNTSGEQEIVDVPDTFFDDFLDNDFMEGLDIVDDVDDDDNESKKVNKEESKKKESRKAKSDKAIKRDPQKTKRDMENYKLKYKKDKQMKLITQRLDSGLVPPGMEMDIEEVAEETPSEDLREKINQLKSRGSDDEGEGKKDKSQKNKGSKSKKRGSFSKSPIKRRSPLRGSKSPIRRKKSPPSNRKISPNDRKKSPVAGSVERKTSPSRMASREKSKTAGTRRSRSLSRPSRGSPGRRRRSVHSRSPRTSPGRNRPDYRAKFPKVWRPRRSRSRSPDRRRRNFRDRSFSPRRRRSRSRSRDAKKYKYVEKTFLEEIAEKLNGVRPRFNNRTNQPNQYNNRMPTQYPVPAAAPSNVVYPPIQQTYDQQFFLGNTNLNPPQNMGQVQSQVPMTTAYPMQQNMMQYPQQQQPQHQPQQQQVPQILPTIPLNPSSIPSIIQPIQKQIQPKPNVQVPSITPDEDLAKLYQQKKISLSDYLCISSRPEVQTSNPEELKEKIKVISRCQDAVKFLNSAEKHTGKLVAKSPFNAEVPTSKYKSPLLRNYKNCLPFTAPPKKVTPGTEFSLYLEQLLNAFGFKTAPEEEPTPVKEAEEESLTADTNINVNRSLMREGMLTKMVQTEPISCRKCEILKRKTFARIGVQCGESQMVSVETQVTEDDLLPKTRSLAALTPAQLLGKKREDAGQFRSNAFRYSPPQEEPRGPPPRTFPAYNPMMQQGINPYPPGNIQYGGPRYGRF